MDKYITRKRRLSPIAPPSKSVKLDVSEDDTDVKLATLASLHPQLTQSLLLDLLLAHEGSVDETHKAIAANKGPRRIAAGTSYQSALAFDVKQKLLSQKGKTLHLFAPADVAQHTPCDVIHNFLPPDEANALLRELLDEAKTYERASFSLFDNVVQSPHSACFYVDSVEEVARQKAEYYYNGGFLTDIRTLTSYMRRILPMVEKTVNELVQARITSHYPGGKKLKYQSPRPWNPNAAFVNCYTGGAESVGYHSDQLTYLGPRPIIGSLSLGVAREFRVRRVVPKGGDEDAAGQIAIHLPHNSLLVMHAEMQEEWKHSIAPTPVIDPHPVAGNRRINITYRDYKASMHPRNTPRCKCNMPCVLRAVQRKRENHGRYFWSCLSGNTPGQDGCAFFEWAEFDDDGERRR